MSLRRQLTKLLSVFKRDAAADEVADEIRCHLNMEELENRAAGMPEEEAREAALRRFGNVTLWRENSRESWAWPPLETLLHDIRFGVRQLRRNRGFAVVAVLTLALGIGATTAIFSIVNAVLLRPLPFKNPERLVSLQETEEAPGDYPLSGADYLDWQKDNRTFESTALFSWMDSMSASGAGEPDSAMVLNTQANFFDVVGVRPIKGRTFAAGEDSKGRNRVAIVSAGFAQRHFGTTEAVGKRVLLNNEAYTVIGVMPAWFIFYGAVDIWTPLDMTPKELGPRGNHGWNGIARLKPGVTLDRARADLLSISKQLEKLYPDSNNRVHAVLTPLKDAVVGDSKAPMLMLSGAVLMVLLIACVNVANLQLARATTRYREMAVRTSLGAGRLRLVRQLLTESVLLACAGAMFGTLAAWWCLRLLQAAKNIPIPRANPLEIDGAVLLFAVALSVVCGILFGLAPALQKYDLALNGDLRAGSQGVLGTSRSRGRLRDALVVIEICITVALLAGAGLLLRSFAHLRSTEIGVNPHHVLTMLINVPKARYSTLSARRQFFDELVSRVQRRPEVESAAASTEIPLQGGSNAYIVLQDKPRGETGRQLVGWNYVTPGYFHTFQIPLIAGRNFTDQDSDETAVTSQTLFEMFKNSADPSKVKMPAAIHFVSIISKDMARIFWPNQNPVGLSFQWNDMKVTVIGVVGDVKEYGIRSKGMPQAYYPLPLALADGGYGRLTVRTRIAPTPVLGAIRQELRALDSSQAVFNAQTMEEAIADDTHDVTVQAVLLGTFATLALILAGIGLYGVMAYLVTQRTREIGIRMALGAQRGNVLQLIMGHGARLTLAGVVLGVLAALALTRSMSALLYGVSSYDPLTFACVAGILAVVALTAYFIPARRAMKVDPMIALRYE